MKSIFLTIGMLVLLTGPSHRSLAVPPDEATVPGETVNLSCTHDLTGLANAWATGYATEKPGKKVTLISEALDPGNLTSLPTGSIALLTGKDLSELQAVPAWKLVVGRDIIVPVMNGQNPLRDEITLRGISQDEFTSIFSSGTLNDWASLANGELHAAVRPLLPDDPSLLTSLSLFIKAGPSWISAAKTEDPVRMLDRVKSEKYSVAFCRLTDLLPYIQDGQTAELAIIPIDINGNDRIDHFEKIYGSPEDFIRGVWIGKYPSALSSRIYAVSAGQPADDDVRAFLEWMVTGGQKHLQSNRLSEITFHERQSGLQALKASVVPLGTKSALPGYGNVYWIVGAVIVIGGLILLALLRIFRDRKDEGRTLSAEPGSVLTGDSVTAPAGLFYDQSHTWAFMEEDGLVRTGIDDFLPRITGQVTRIKMKKSGEVVRKGEVYVSIIQDGKQLDIQSPVSGTVSRINMKLISQPSVINADPLYEGWVYKVQPMNWMKEIRSYMTGERYTQWIGDEFSRLRDFFAYCLSSGTAASPVLQEGGEIYQGVLENCDPAIWEEFQVNFINPLR